MPIRADDDGGSKEFEIHPAGTFPGLCLDVQDKGMVDSEYQGKTTTRHKGVLWFWCGQRDSEGRLLLVNMWFTLSTFHKAAIWPFLRGWLGDEAPGTGEGDRSERVAFDFETLIARPSYLTLVHNVGKNGKTYCNIGNAAPPYPNMEVPAYPDDFVRFEDREPRDEGVGQGAPPQGPPNDSDVPF